ncbi:ABC transporter ATP-binding protein [Flavobacterium aurantiibacter]|uniref:ABC transporter n=1 Tax=Flavobacterium aurantiibacter TaxID=2023067 RepID=A0A255ZZI9_9FLAO|nr:ABC transporter ATP-binding protein [Flavobacterium aurantiibacter]OYQ46903.1 ABC transporter [Flavobacterium aurantiibacter]
MKELQYLNKYFVKYKIRFLTGILITIVAQIFYLYTPKLISNSIASIENYIKNSETVDVYFVQSQLIKNILLIIATTLLAGLLTFLMRQTLIVMSRLIEFDLKNEVFVQYTRLSQQFYKQNRTGDLMNRISEDVGKVRMYVGPAVMYTINTFIRFAIVIGYMYAVSPRLTLYTLLPLPILSYAIFKLSTEINKRSTFFQQNLSNLSSFSQELFSGLRVVKAYALEKKQQQKVIALSAESKTKAMELAKSNALFGPLMIALIGFSNLIVIYFGGLMYINQSGGIMHIGQIAEFILYVNMLTWPVASLGWVSSMVQEAAASQKRINEFLKIESELKSGDQSLKEVHGAFIFDHVSYRYEDTNIQALSELNFEVKSGETLAIFGKTGSGKSTLLNLIARLDDADTGSIKMDTINIKDYNLQELRSQIGFVPQDAFLFSDTIANNIRFGNELASEEEIVQAAKMAAVHENIENFAQQYETVLGERGITLSGGQKQRVSLARALLKNSPILVFDDCLSAVDTETEEEILDNLKKFSQNRTTFIVSHRVSSAKNADKILVLEDGKMIQFGTPEELLAQNGYYRELYLKQLSEKESA